MMKKCVLLLIVFILCICTYSCAKSYALYGKVIEKKDGFIVVTEGTVTYNVKCSDLEDICVNDSVTITYHQADLTKISELNYEVTAKKVALTNDAELTYFKPVIYLYPTEEKNINVKLNYNGKLVCTYPNYNNGWNVIASPDGTLINKADGKEYSYLFWEGNSNIEYDMSKGFVVKGEDTAEFLQEKLAYMGLTPKEYNEFIVFWLPRMQNNEYNLITFQGKTYTDNAVLDISPKPDSILRIFMVYKPLDEFINIEEQELNTFTRQGFTVVEWGGTCLE